MNMQNIQAKAQQFAQNLMKNKGAANTNMPINSATQPAIGQNVQQMRPKVNVNKPMPKSMGGQGMGLGPGGGQMNRLGAFSQAAQNPVLNNQNIKPEDLAALDQLFTFNTMKSMGKI